MPTNPSALEKSQPKGKRDLPEHTQELLTVLSAPLRNNISAFTAAEPTRVAAGNKLDTFKPH